MKQLFPNQKKAADFLTKALLNGRAALDSSHTGVGKTVVACHIAKDMGLPVVIICPKIVIPHWKRELAEMGIVPEEVINYEKLKRGNRLIAKLGKKTFRWLLEKPHLLIWDECHKCKSPFSQNSQMLIAAKQAGHYNLMLSATACKDPTEMRAIGYALGLHSLNKPEGKLKSWFSWMLGYGCTKDPWNNWVLRRKECLSDLNQILYSTNCSRLTPNDLPTAFAANHVITEPLAFASLRDIAKFYEQHGLTPEIVEQFMENGGASPHILVEILRARQLAEAAKVPDIIEMINDAVTEGYSVAVFMNFSDTISALAKAFPDASIIVGGQSETVRETNVQRFQNNETKVILANLSAGGVGVSLHDIHGGHPRMSLISPTFNTAEYIQTLGRVHRAGAQSPALQRVLVAAKTIEEKVLTKLEEKRKALDTLHAQQ